MRFSHVTGFVWIIKTRTSPTYDCSVLYTYFTLALYSLPNKYLRCTENTGSYDTFSTDPFDFIQSRLPLKRSALPPLSRTERMLWFLRIPVRTSEHPPLTMNRWIVTNLRDQERLLWLRLDSYRLRYENDYQWPSRDSRNTSKSVCYKSLCG